MYFKLTNIVKSLDLGKNEHLEFKLNSKEGEITVAFSKVAVEGTPKGARVGDYVVEAKMQYELSSKRIKLFETISKPLDSSLSDLLKELTKNLSKAIEDTISTIRWVHKLTDCQSYIRYSKGIKWSNDGENDWEQFPDQIHFEISVEGVYFINFESHEVETVQKLLAKNKFEPLGHELLIEAWSLKKENPRSALVMGIAAAETSFKNFVANMIPEASWLISEIQSPPLIKMLSDFLPKITTNLQMDKIAFKPFVPKGILNEIQKGVTIRNELVHGKVISIQPKKVNSILIAVRDLLYLLDLYSGHLWAERNISHETISKIKEEISKGIKKNPPVQ